MKKLNQKREDLLKYQGNLCPRIRKLVEKVKEDSATSIPTWAEKFSFQVKTMYGEQFSVDLSGRTGISCSHAMSCIFHIRENPENFIHDCYKKTAQMRIYEPVIAPMDGPDMWEPTDLLDVNPPNYEPKKSKLNKNRRKEPDEIETSKRKAVKMKKQKREKKKKQSATSEMHDVTKLSKKGKLGRCSKFLQTGHNKITCKKSSDSSNSTTLPQATQTTQDWCQNATSQSPPK
nr:uncharacterized protein LOC104091973 isoform X2 [Nicotiana tomentosiformis]